MVGEGIETCLAAMQATGMPAWAALSTSGLARLLLPAEVRAVIILADHDANGAGERAARDATARWELEGRHVSVWMSPNVGQDANDLLLAACYAA
jgi:putative DNA primase/helicase